VARRDLLNRRIDSIVTASAILWAWGPGRRLIVFNSTWAPRSLFADSGEPETDDLLRWLLSRPTSELPAAEYQAVAVLHPNIWYGHGSGQVHTWLDDARRSGLDARRSARRAAADPDHR
jgi:hypothetical protein